MTIKVVSASEDDLLPTSTLQMTFFVTAEEAEEAGVLEDRLDTTTTK